MLEILRTTATLCLGSSLRFRSELYAVLEIWLCSGGKFVSVSVKIALKLCRKMSQK